MASLPLDYLADRFSKTWMSQNVPPGTQQQAQQQKPEGMLGYLGGARKSIFDFFGKDPNSPTNNYGLNVGMQQQQIPPAQAQQFNNPAQNQQAMQLYQQTMQAIKQKRGF